jgi:Tol biopolymer transport system component
VTRSRAAVRSCRMLVATALAASAFVAPASFAASHRPGVTQLISSVAAGVTKVPVAASLPGFEDTTSISADGRFVAFSSAAPNLVDGDRNASTDVFVRDRLRGTTELVSRTPRGTSGIGACVDPQSGTLLRTGSGRPYLTPSGRFVAFVSCAADLVPGDHNAVADVYVFDRQRHTMTLASVATGGGQADQGVDGEPPSLSDDGAVVAWSSTATSLVPGDTNGSSDVFVRDLRTRQTSRISTDAQGQQQAANSMCPKVSPDGHRVLFSSWSSTLVGDDTNGISDVFVVDRANHKVLRVSTNSQGQQAMGLATGSDTCDVQQRSWDAAGRQVLFHSAAVNLAPAWKSDLLTQYSCYVHSLVDGRTQRVNVTSSGDVMPGNCTHASLSRNGRFVAFMSFTPASAEDDADADGFSYDRSTGTLDWLTPSATGGKSHGTGASGDKGVTGLDISADGRYVSFASDADDLTASKAGMPAAGDDPTNTYLRDRGPTTGVAGLVASGRLAVVPAPGFKASGVVASTDRADDVDVAGAGVGANLTGVSIAYRAELNDVFVRIELAQLRDFKTGLGCAMVIGAGFSVAGTAYQARACSASLDPGWALWVRQRDRSWVRIRTLSGNVGTTGDEAVVAIPLVAIGAANGGRVQGFHAFTELTAGPLGRSTVMDTANLATAS